MRSYRFMKSLRSNEDESTEKANDEVIANGESAQERLNRIELDEEEYISLDEVDSNNDS